MVEEAVSRCLRCQKTSKPALTWFKHDSHKWKITVQEAKMAEKMNIKYNGKKETKKNIVHIREPPASKLKLHLNTCQKIKHFKLGL
jgi:hypothetical protein